jgi:hypothetical protein
MPGMNAAKQEKLVLEAPAARLLALAERRLGELGGAAALWGHWPGFARGPLAAWAALGEVGLMGLELDAAELLALGPEPDPSRPAKPLRWAVGLTHARRRLEAQPETPLTPLWVSQLYRELDAPGLARGAEPPEPPQRPIPGAAAWTLAPRWLESGLPPLWAAGLALAAWEREGPEEPRREVAGRVFLWGLAPRLGLPELGLARLGPAMHAAAGQLSEGWDGLMASVRREGAWRRLLVVFLAAVEASARAAAGLLHAARELNRAHRELLDTWVHAPKNPKRLLDLLLARPVLDLPEIARSLEVTQRTAGLLAEKLQDQGLLAEITGQQRGRRYAYLPLLKLIQPGWGEEREQAPSI